MTAQIADIMILDGAAFKLHTTPLEGHFERIKWRPACRRSTGNYRGYVARWELFGERLFLTGLFAMGWNVPEHLIGKLAPDPDPYEPAPDETVRDDVKSLRLQDLFPKQAPLVFAEWVTERLVVATGPRLIYVHFGFGSLHSSYRTIDVAEGRVRSIRDWDGREWARETGRFWPDDEWYKEHPQALVWPEPNARGKRAEESEPDHWRTVRDARHRRFRYQYFQIKALHKPCGQKPIE
jgi:hypothetical protein